MDDNYSAKQIIAETLKTLSSKPLDLISQMISDLLTIPASKIRHFAFIHSVPNTVSARSFESEIYSKLALIEESKIIFPEMQVLNQAINDSAYCMEHKELRMMFASLIANSCNADFLKLMHPSFSSTLKNMSPYDAVLFQKLAQNIGSTTDATEYLVLSKDSPDYLILHKCIIFVDEFFKDFDMQSLSVSALKKLGLIDYDKSTPYEANEVFTSNEYFKNLQAKYSGTASYPVARWTQIYLTPYGEALAIACSISPLNSE